MKLIINFICLSFLIVLLGCELVEKQVPQNSVDAAKAITTPAGARAAMNGVYDNVQSGNYLGLRYTLFPDFHGATNLRHTGTFPSFAQIANRTILVDNVEVSNMWQVIYVGINRANQIIDQAPKVTDPAFTDKDKLVAEAKFFRALHYFNLLRYWGGVPIILTPTNEVDVVTLQVPRNSPEEVYQQVISDLSDANIALLPTLVGNRVSQAAAYALRARVRLYRREWDQAISDATLAGTGRVLTTNFINLFEARSTNEVIWFVAFSDQDQNSFAFFLLPSANGGRNEMRPTTTLQGLYATNDTRRILTTSTGPSLKYYRPATGDDFTLVFRLAEMLLIRAESLVERNTGTDLDDAVVLINQIRNRAGIGNYTGTIDQTSLRNEVFNQRRLELALEGHFFFDVVRTGRAATTFTNWVDSQALFPIPFREMNANPKLVQNPGY